MRLVRNELQATAAGTLQARPTETFEDLPVGLVFRSVGYRGVPIPGVPFQDAWGVIWNDKGRVLDPDSREPRPGEYVAGWIKRGPTGVIGTNKPDAAETVACMVEDLARDRVLAPSEPDAGAAVALVRQRQPHYISWPDWQRLDALEVARGRAAGRPRVKFTRVEEMLAALGYASGILAALGESMRARVVSSLVSGGAVLLAACAPSTVLRPILPPSFPHGEYARSLRQAGLDQTALGRDWLAAAEHALLTPLSVTLPYRETGYIAPEEPAAVAYRFDARRGQRLRIDVEVEASEAGRIFIDLFRQGSGSDLPEHVTSAPPGTGRLEFEIARDGTVPPPPSAGAPAGRAIHADAAGARLACAFRSSERTAGR